MNLTTRPGARAGERAQPVPYDGDAAAPTSTWSSL